MVLTAERMCRISPARVVPQEYNKMLIVLFLNLNSCNAGLSWSILRAGQAVPVISPSYIKKSS
jgi:hypothetical protein